MSKRDRCSRWVRRAKSFGRTCCIYGQLSQVDQFHFLNELTFGYNCHGSGKNGAYDAEDMRNTSTKLSIISHLYYDSYLQGRFASSLGIKSSYGLSSRFLLLSVPINLYEYEPTSRSPPIDYTDVSNGLYGRHGAHLTDQGPLQY